MWDIFKLKKAGIFAGGVLFGTAGVKILASDDAKKVYTNCTAAVLRAKDCVMKTATTVQENAEDILAEAQQINESRAAKEAEAVYEAEEAEETETQEENTGAQDCPEDGGCIIMLDDDTIFKLTETGWNKVIREGLKHCGYVKDQKVTSIKLPDNKR